MLFEIKNTLLHSSSYLIGSYMIDCGDGNKIVQAIEDKGIELKGIFLTHCHQDHIYGLQYVMEHYPQANIYCSQATFKGLENDENVVIIEEGIHQLNDDTTVEVISTKGHSNDSQSYIIDGNIFTGDAHIPFAKVFTKWPTSLKADAIESEQRILKLVNERQLIIRPGHWQ